MIQVIDNHITKYALPKTGKLSTGVPTAVTPDGSEPKESIIKEVM